VFWIVHFDMIWLCVVDPHTMDCNGLPDSTLPHTLLWVLCWWGLPSALDLPMVSVTNVRTLLVDLLVWTGRWPMRALPVSDDSLGTAGGPLRLNGICVYSIASRLAATLCGHFKLPVWTIPTSQFLHTWCLRVADISTGDILHFYKLYTCMNSYSSPGWILKICHVTCLVTCFTFRFFTAAGLVDWSYLSRLNCTNCLAFHNFLRAVALFW
jgi:hypothetical protein